MGSYKLSTPDSGVISLTGMIDVYIDEGRSCISVYLSTHKKRLPKTVVFCLNIAVLLKSMCVNNTHKIATLNKW